MINLRNLTSILEDHKLTDEQSEELQKVIYMLADGRLAETDLEFEKSNGIQIFYLCDVKNCTLCYFKDKNCSKHTADIRHSKNYKSVSEVNLEKDFTMHVISINNLEFWEKER